MYDLLIVGTGPAGITAAIYAKRANLKVAILEKGAPGGQILNTAEIENYPGFKKITGFELASAMLEHVVELDVEVIYEEVVFINDLGNKKEIVTTEQKLEAKAVLIASGAVPRTLGVKGEENYSYKGISWCAICDGPFYKDKRVVVIGGGNSAVEESIFLSNIAKHITIVQNLDHLTADKKSIERLEQSPNVDFIYNAEVLEFMGDETLKSVKVLSDGKEIVINTDGVFEYIGLIPVTDFAKELNITNRFGYIETNEEMATSVKGIFAAGDVIEKQVRQIVTATNDGAIAVQSILKFLEIN